MSEVGPSSTSEANLDQRFNAIADRLGALIGLVHPRLSDPKKCLNVADILAARLTYGQVVAHYPTSESPDLPPTAIRCDDPEVNCLLMERHLRSIDASFLPRLTSLGHPRKLAGLPVTHLQAGGKYRGEDTARSYSPTVEGYNWYSGYVVNTNNNNAAIILAPYMQPWREGGSPFPIVYTLGEIEMTAVREVVHAYADDYPSI